MSGLTREGARLRAEVRIKYVDFQADLTHQIDKAITPIVSGGRARMIGAESWYQAVLCAAVKRRIDRFNVVFGAGPGSAWCSKRELSGERKLDPVRWVIRAAPPPGEREALQMSPRRGGEPGISA